MFRRATVSILVLVLVMAALSLRHNSKWDSKTFSLTPSPGEFLVFGRDLSVGDTLLYRLDTKPGAEGKGTLMLTTPSGEVRSWNRSYREYREQVQLEIEENGRYQLVLVTKGIATDSRATPPEIEVDWRLD